MTKLLSLLRSAEGFTLVEIVLTVACLTILMAIASASYSTIQARVRCSQVKADMDAIAQAGYTDYSYNGYFADTPLDVSSEPQSFIDEGLLSNWPIPPCPGYFFAWENWGPLGYNATRVVLYTGNVTALWDYCVDVAGGGYCSVQADPTIGNPVDISDPTLNYLYCDQQ